MSSLYSKRQPRNEARILTGRPVRHRIILLPLLVKAPMTTKPVSWKPDSICLRPTMIDVRSIALDVYNHTCCTTFDSPGFCVVNVSSSIGSLRFVSSWLTSNAKGLSFTRRERMRLWSICPSHVLTNKKRRSRISMVALTNVF